jgi:hypothetical protein
VQLAEALIEVQAEETAPKPKLSPARALWEGSCVRPPTSATAAGASWSLSEAGAIKQFFMLRFGRPLPIDVFGQSPLHDRWGLDHRNAMDIGLNPDKPGGASADGILRANGVPFTAFHFAIPGVRHGTAHPIGFRRTGLQRLWPAGRSVKKECLCREK